MPSPLRAVLLFIPWSLQASAALAQVRDTQDEGSAFRLQGVFVQAGNARGADTLSVGALWDWPWSRSTDWGRWSAYWELSGGRWSTGRDARPRESSWVTQFGWTPVLRLQPQQGSGAWFVEAGIGLHVLTPIYRNGEKRFSTTVNFGDHVAAGYLWGPQHEHELALRYQHFSNGGLKRPNPGENFVQLRYVRRF